MEIWGICKMHHWLREDYKDSYRPTILTQIKLGLRPIKNRSMTERSYLRKESSVTNIAVFR